MIAKLKDIIFTRDGQQIVSFSTRANCRELFDRLKDGEVDVELKKHTEKRSMNANRYCWVLCEAIAEELNDGATSKEDVYRDAIKAVGQYKEIGGLALHDAQTLRFAWEKLGIGWITEQVDYEQDGDHVVIRFYYGSSTYKVKRMSRLIDHLVQDAKALGIPTETPNQIAKMLSLWEQDERRWSK